MSKIYSWMFSLLTILVLLCPQNALAKVDSSSSNTGTNKHLALLYHISGKDIEKRFDNFVTNKVKTIGFKLTDPHRRVNDVYKKLYGKTALDLLSFLPVVNDTIIKPLLTIDPRLAGFNPFNMLIYKKADEANYHFGHLDPVAILDIIGIEDKAVREDYIASFEELDALLAEEFGKENASYLEYKALPQKRMMTYLLEFEKPEYIDDFIDEFQESFEETFAAKGYVIAGFHNYMEEEDDPVLSAHYDGFWTYALCHMKYSSTVFDNEGMEPNAGVFAPCTMYMFIPKGTNKLYIGMPYLDNVRVALNIKDKMRTEFMRKLDGEIAQTLEEMGAKEIPNINPLTTLSKERETGAASATAAVIPVKEIEITDKRLAKMYIFDGNIEEKYNPFVEKTINEIGFKLTDPHKRVNDHYKEKYGSTNLDVLSFMSIANESVVKPLFNLDPRLAGFNPFNLLIYKRLDDKVTHVGHLTANAILDMLSITDPKVREAYTKSIEQLDALIKEKLGGKEVILEAKSYAKDRMMNFAVPFDKEKPIDDVVDEFQEQFEEAFEDKEYIIAGFNNFKETDGEDTIPEFEAFWTYSLCHFKFSYTIFDNEGGHPEAGLFAPCTMYMYIRKGDNRIIVGMPKLANWKATLGIEEKVRSDFVEKLDREIPEIMHSLGAIDIENTNPLLAVVPKADKAKAKALKTVAVANVKPKKEVKETISKTVAVSDKTPAKVAPVKAPVVKTEQPKPKTQPKEKQTQKVDAQKANGYKIQVPTPPKPVAPLNVITVGGSDIRYTPRKEENAHGIIFSQRRPPDYGEGDNSAGDNAAEQMPGEAVAGRVSTYLKAPFIDTARVSEQLKQAGFKVLGVIPVNKKGTLKTVTFTCPGLLALAQKPNSGFVGVMRVLVNKENNEIAVTNPLYFARAYMGDYYDGEGVKKVLTKLNKAFPKLENSGDKLKFTLLPKYRFMDGMPYYQDMVTVGKAKTSKALLEKLKSKGKAVKFIQEIAPDTYLVGVALGKRTSKFIKKTGTHNAFLLPYPILIQKGVAKIMEPKYYISVNYPMLKMSNFMKIATIPDAIRNDCEKLFK